MDFFRTSKELEQPTTPEHPKVNYAESPSLYIFEQFKVATDRISTIREVQNLMLTDLRFILTNQRVAADAARGGFKVIVTGSETDRQQRRRLGKSIPKRLTPGANIAQQVIDDMLKRTKLPIRAKEHVRKILRDGDLFLNPLVDLGSGQILDIRRAPALTMKRNNDSYGEFPDPEKAFSQIDPKTQINVLLEIGPPSVSRADFALYQMNHIRWLWDETIAYGTSQYAAARAIYKILQPMEQAASVRRQFRSVLKLNHELPEGTPEPQVIEYMRNVGLIDENGNPTRNAHLLSDFVGTAKVTALRTEPNMGDIDDIKYFDEMLWLQLMLPKAIFTGGSDLNRDVLKIQYPHYLQTLEDITDVLEFGDSGQFSGYRAIINLQLLLAGINPDAVNYDIVWSDKTDETPAERIDRIQKALGAENGVQVITLEKAIQEIAGDYDIEDPVGMAQRLEEERQHKEVQQQAAFQKQQSQQKQESQLEQEPVIDVMLEDRPKVEVLEKKAQATVQRFFRAVYKRMLNYSEPIADNAILDFSEEAVVTILNDAWDEEASTYQVSIVKSMTDAGSIGAERAVQLVVGKKALPEDELSKIRVTRTDIRDDLLEASGERIKGIKDTTLNNVREALSEGFEADLGWKQLMKQLKPIIVDDVRAEMTARTELSWAYSRMTKRVYVSAGYNRVEWSAVIDQRTCPICLGLDGQTFPIDNHPDIPRHPRCRCSLLPAD